MYAYTSSYHVEAICPDPLAQVCLLQPPAAANHQQHGLNMRPDLKGQKRCLICTLFACGSLHQASFYRSAALQVPGYSAVCLAPRQ